MRSHESRAGFTLAELLVVILILGLSAAVVAPAMHAGPADSLAAATDDVVRLLESARRSAADRALPVRLTLDPSGRFRAEARSGDSTIVLADSTLALGGARLDSERPAVVTFDPLGTATPATLRLRLHSATRTVRIDRWTGAVRREVRR